MALLASVIVGDADTCTMTPVDASLPAEVVVNPAPASVAASAYDVPVPKVKLFQMPAGVVLSVK
jgi:hypothetical protein